MATALRYGADIALGVADLHRAGIMHRDIKPSNVLFRADAGGIDRLVIADLGLSKRLAEASGFTLAAGTPGYMAPEQSSGLDLDHRVDVYGVAATVYDLLTGTKPDVTEGRTTEHHATRSTRGRRRGSAARTGPQPRRSMANRPRPGQGTGRTGRRTTRSDFSTAGDRRRRGDHSAAGRAATRAHSRRSRESASAAVGPVGWPAAAAVLVIAGAAVVVAAPWEREAAADLVDVSDDDGRITLTVPAAWAEQRQGGGWLPTDIGLAAADPSPAVAVAGDLEQWRDPGSRTPGVFVGLSGDAELVDKALALRHDGCQVGTATRRQGALTGQIVRWTCPNDVTFDEAGLRTTGGTSVYVQIKQPTGEQDHAEEILASIRMR